MPRRPSRPLPPPHLVFPSLRGDDAQDDRPADSNDIQRFHEACIAGLLSRLEAKDNKEKFLRDVIPELQREFTSSMPPGGRYAKEFVIRFLTYARPRRKNEIDCNPGLLLYHYALAGKLLRGVLTSHRRSPKRRAEALTRYAEELYRRLNEEPYKCVCERRITPPGDFQDWAFHKRTEREIILKLLAHHHGHSSDESLRRLLDNTARQLRSPR